MDNREKAVLISLVTLAAISVSVYLIVSRTTYRIGFPLDDAWIHQSYARNLAARGEWAFMPGQPSGGSTAPLWSALLALGYLVHWGPYGWTYFLGWICLASLSIIGYYGFRVLHPSNPGWAILAGALLAMEWHLVWSAVSGMETALFTLIVFLVLVLLTMRWKNWMVIGGLIGLSLWIRPDGITLFVPAFLCLFVLEESFKQRIHTGLFLLLGFVLFAMPYVLFQWELTGHWLPNTFYAKQAEYSIELLSPLWRRLAEQALLPMIGVGIILLPGLLAFIWKAIRARRWVSLSGILWAFGYIGLYAVRLPVTYQHGRYVIPMMPVYFVWGLAGLVDLLQLRSPIFWKRTLSRAWLISAGVVLLCFWVIGARAYGRDVATIESEMVSTAQWIAVNTEPDALVAAHDIGALGFFSNRRLLDMAGLVSPEVIPFIRDERRLAQFLDEQKAEYLVTFPDWYPDLVKLARPIYQSHGSFSPAQGGENMVVYRWGAEP
jgi:hypothetical protein